MNTLRSLFAGAVTLGCLAFIPADCRAAADSAIAPAPTTASVTNAPAPKAQARTRKLEEDELLHLLTATLNEKLAENGATWELRLTRPWAAVVVPDAPLAAEIIEPAPNRITSACILRFELRADKKLLGSWQVAVQARLWREVLVARASLQRGQLLRDTDFNHERRDLLTVRQPLVELPAQNVDYELAESVPIGSPLTARAIRLKPVIARGQLADAVIRDGAMMISVKVEVLEEGAPGQIVRVRNPQSRRELRGKVLDEQTVAIPL